jgi:hypothetical protein
MTDYVALVNGRPTLRAANSTSAGVADAGKIPKLDSAGKLDATLMPTGLGSDSKVMTAIEAIAARDFVNVTTTGIRKADASNDRPAHGFVLAAIANAATGTVFFEGTVTGLTGLTIGSRYFLSDSVPGTAVLTSPTPAAGKISQEVGVAISVTEISFEPQQAIVLG